MELVVTILWPLSLALAGLWAVRIWMMGLVRAYPWLSSYLLLNALVGSCGVVFYFSPMRIGLYKAYDIWWVLAQPIFWVLTFGVVFEIYDHLLDDYRGLQRLGRLVMRGALGAVAAIVAGLAFTDVYRMTDLNRWKVFWLAQEQSIHLVLAGLLFSLFLFQKVFCHYVSPNLRLLFATFGLFLCGDAILSVLRSYLGVSFRPIRDVAGVTLYTACLAAGLARFSAAGERESSLVGLAALSRPALADMAHAASRQLKAFSDRLENILTT